MWLSVVSLALGFDHSHAAFGTFLAGAVDTRGVDYRALAARHDALKGYLDTLAAADVSGFTRDQQLAFWVNAYNAHTLNLMLSEGPPKSIRDLDGGKVWSTRTMTVAGRSVTLDTMEHQHARKLADGRVHAVVNCASRGCPPLPPKPMSAATVGAQLDEAARAWARTNAYRIDGGSVALSSIFDWFGDDFASVKGERDLPGIDGKAEQAVWFLAAHVDADARAALLGVTAATWAEYDWSLNQR